MNRQSKGGLARAAALTAEQRRAIAQKAAQARWASTNPKRRVNVAKQLSSLWGVSESTYYRQMRVMLVWADMVERGLITAEQGWSLLLPKRLRSRLRNLKGPPSRSLRQ